MRGISHNHEQRGRVFRIFLSEKDCTFYYDLGYVPIHAEPSKTRVLLGKQQKNWGSFLKLVGASFQVVL